MLKYRYSTVLNRAVVVIVVLSSSKNVVLVVEVLEVGCGTCVLCLMEVIYMY